ncbi:MAG: YchF/TatD family DNA exonuclease [Gammaproteobacteria bacterium]|nr:YchF/TatD family DNA exonuclease [Gammaproteobacteria bacterium]
MTSLVDSHCHIPMIEDSDGIETILAAARENDVTHMLCVSVELDSYPEILSLARNHSCISASVGVHPNTEMQNEIEIDELAGLASDSNVVAIGETGLDYFRSEGDLEWQRERFRSHIRAARQVNKPLIIHCREAKEDVIKILKEENAADVGGVMHCFVEDWETAQTAMALNFRISFSGIVTFKNAQPLKEVAKKVPLEMLLVETDSPYLAPVPFRGKSNQPAFVKHVAEHIAELRQLPYEQIADSTTGNFYKLFPLAAS